MPSDMMKVQPDLGTVFANLNAAGVEGAIKDYCLARLNGDTVAPELAKAAFMQAKKLVDAGLASGDSDISIGAGKTVSLDLLQELIKDINQYAKFAASREKMLKLAAKFEKLLK